MNSNHSIERSFPVFYFDQDWVRRRVSLTCFYQRELHDQSPDLDISVVREATAALQSVFPQTELGNFLSLSKRDKDRQLIELTQIVTGIRLFNKECGKGGEGIDNLPGKFFPAFSLNQEISPRTIFSDLKRSDTGYFERNPTTNR